MGDFFLVISKKTACEGAIIVCSLVRNNLDTLIYAITKRFFILISLKQYISKWVFIVLRDLSQYFFASPYNAIKTVKF